MLKEELADGERLPLHINDIGSCEVFPQTIQYNPNGRFEVVCVRDINTPMWYGHIRCASMNALGLENLTKCRILFRVLCSASNGA